MGPNERDSIPAAEARGYAIVRGCDDTTRDQDWYEEWACHCSAEGRACLAAFFDAATPDLADVHLDTDVTGWRLSKLGEQALIEAANTWLDQPWVPDRIDPDAAHIVSARVGARLDYQMYRIPAFCVDPLLRAWAAILTQSAAVEEDDDGYPDCRRSATPALVWA